MNTPSLYRKKPIPVEVLQWTGENIREMASWLHNSGFYRNASASFGASELVIHTLEGDMKAKPGDWIIKGVRGEFYPCEESIFAETYEPVE